jgi:tetratricopeptide (TPR) repeat protein
MCLDELLKTQELNAMLKSKGISCPEGSILVTPLDDREWTFEYPRLAWEIYESFHDAIDEWQMGDVDSAEDTYRELIADYPEFIDVYHHLALLLSETGRGKEAFQIWREVVDFGLACLPLEFEAGRDRLSWLMLENRPFLRAYHGLGLEYLERGEVETALEIFDTILAMNPGDNQGVRALVVDCNLRLNRPDDVLAVCGQYPDDGMEQVIYGRVLALYQLGRKAEAENALGEAIDFLPLVAEEIVARRHTKPRNLRPGYVTHGGADQAYYYWTEQGAYWKNTPGAIGFVRDYLQQLRQVPDQVETTQEHFAPWLAKYGDPEIVRQAEELPLRRDMVTLLTYVRDNKVVGTQSTGNMPLKAVREVTARFVNPPQLDTTIGDHTYRLRTEEDVWPLYFLHILADVGGMLAIAPARRWRLTAGGELFLGTDPLLQVASLITVWWYGINWLVAFPMEGMGEALPPAFQRATLARLRGLPTNTRIPFEEFADHFIEHTGLTWTAPDPHVATMALRASIERMVILILAAFGGVEREYREEPLGNSTISKLDAFELTPFGEALLDAVAIAGR